MSLAKLQAFQESLKTCQSVYAVEVTCDGESSIESLWDTRAAAEMCRDWHNNMEGNRAGYYGRARVLSMPVKTEQMAHGLYSPEGESDE